jgi:3-hydroxybutyryl-CoA dehydratase
MSSVDVKLPPVGAEASLSKTVSESDVYLFGGITMDLAPQHVDEDYMSGHAFGHRVVHGVLLLGFASAVSAKLSAEQGITTVSYGYDKVRFTAPVFFGDTITAHARVARVEAPRTYLDITVTDQRGRTCAIAAHVLYHPGDVG